MFFGLNGVDFLEKFVKVTPEGIFIYRDEGTAEREIGMQMGVLFKMIDRVVKVKLKSPLGTKLNAPNYAFFIKLTLEGAHQGLKLQPKKPSKLVHSEYVNTGMFKGMSGTMARNLEMGDSLFQELKGLPEICNIY